MSVYVTGESMKIYSEMKNGGVEAELGKILLHIVPGNVVKGGQDEGYCRFVGLPFDLAKDNKAGWGYISGRGQSLHVQEEFLCRDKTCGVFSVGQWVKYKESIGIIMALQQKEKYAWVLFDASLPAQWISTDHLYLSSIEAALAKEAKEKMEDEKKVGEAEAKEEKAAPESRKEGQCDETKKEEKADRKESKEEKWLTGFLRFASLLDEFTAVELFMVHEIIPDDCFSFEVDAKGDEEETVRLMLLWINGFAMIMEAQGVPRNELSLKITAQGEGACFLTATLELE